jgi:ribosomal protein S27E
MPKPNDDQPLMIRCPNCKQTREPDYDETSRQYKCPICTTRVDIQVSIEKKKRGIK